MWQNGNAAVHAARRLPLGPVGRERLVDLAPVGQPDVDRASPRRLPRGLQEALGVTHNEILLTRAAMSSVRALSHKTFGVPDVEAAHFLAGGKYSQHEHALAQQTQARAQADRGFMEKWKAGDPAAKRLMWAVSAVLAAGVESRAMKFVTTFANPDTGEERVIVVDLDDKPEADPATDYMLPRSFSLAPMRSRQWALRMSPTQSEGSICNDAVGGQFRGSGDRVVRGGVILVDCDRTAFDQDSAREFTLPPCCRRAYAACGREMVGDISKAAR